MSLFTVEKPGKSLGGWKDNHNLDFYVNEGGILGIIGTNGYGKTTSLMTGRNVSANPGRVDKRTADTSMGGSPRLISMVGGAI